MYKKMINKIVINIITMDDYINDYINNRIMITGDENDMILSCNIRYDLNKNNELFQAISYQAIAKNILSNANIKKKIIKGSMHYIGIKYK
jgi:hypothetical protein